MLTFGAIIWVLCVGLFTDYGGRIHWGADIRPCIQALILFLFAYGSYFIGFRFYISKVITILCCILAVWDVIVLAGTIHWILCIPAGILAAAAAIGMSVLVWKTFWE